MSNHNIAIFRTGALGDVILTLPVIQNLRLAFPNAHIHLIGNPNLLSLAETNKIQIHDFNRSIWATLFAPKSNITSELYDLFQNTNLALSYLLDPDHILTQNLKRLGVSQTIMCPPKPETQIHAIKHLLAPLHNLNIPTPKLQPKIPLTEADYKHEYAKAPRVPALLIHPGSGSTTKCWPPEHFASVADRLIRETGCQVILSSGPADEGRVNQVTHFMTEEAMLLPQLPIRHFAAFMPQCTAYLGNDSGPSHLSAAMGLPTIVLFGPTDPKIWGPCGPAVQTIQSPTSDMNTLLPNQVYPRLLKLFPNCPNDNITS